MEELYGLLYASRIGVPTRISITCITAYGIKRPIPLAAIFRCPPHHNFISPHSARSNYAAGFSASLGLHCRSPPP